MMQRDLLCFTKQKYLHLKSFLLPFPEDPYNWHPRPWVWVANGRVGADVGRQMWALDKWTVAWLGMGGHWAGQRTKK